MSFGGNGQWLHKWINSKGNHKGGTNKKEKPREGGVKRPTEGHTSRLPDVLSIKCNTEIQIRSHFSQKPARKTFSYNLITSFKESKR